MYHCALGQFLTRDPWPHAAAPTARHENPWFGAWLAAMANRYGYASSDPLYGVDPEGLAALHFPPTASAPWYLGAGTGTFIDVEIRFDCIPCHCDATWYRLLFSIDGDFGIFLNPGQLLQTNAWLPGIYGHEQRHVESARGFLEVTQQALTGVEAASNCNLADEQCTKRGEAYTKLYMRAWLVFYAADKRHENASSPANAREYPPIGQMPASPSES